MATSKTLLQQAQDFNEKEEYQAVIDLLPDAVLQAENSADLYAEKAQAYYRLGDIAPCEAMANMALAIDGTNAKANHYKGNFYADLLVYDESIKWYKKAIEFNPKFDYPYNGLGAVFSEKKEYYEAIKWYKKAIELNPRSYYSYNGLGDIYRILKDYPKASEYFNKGIEFNPQSKALYYNRALLYEELGEPEKALADYECYIKLANDKASYYAQRANERIAELKKNIKNPRLGSIAELVANIKKLLLFSDGNITHYTSLSAAKILILDAASRFRLSEGAFLNDTSEGRELFTYLDFQAKPRKSNDIEALPFATKPFIGSFVAETKHDDLTLWRMYGKEEKEEAKGCAITMHQQQLVASIQNEVTSNKQGLGIKQDEAFSFYRVAYIGHDKKFILPGASEKEAELNGYMLDLAGKLGKKPKTIDEERQDIIKHLNEIAFLFKTIEYQHEQELRLVLDGIGSEKKVDTSGTMPRVYIELVNIRPLIQKITIGPKVERGDEWAAAFYYSLDKDGLRPEICISHLPYK
jgi:tetratricopeptide (TPR) repeat protein